MSTDEDLREWLVTLSAMTDGALDTDAPLEDGLLWIAEKPESDFDEIRAIGDADPKIGEFLNLGRKLLQRFAADAHI